MLSLEKVDCMLFLVQVVDVAVSDWIIKLLPLNLHPNVCKAAPISLYPFSGPMKLDA